MGLAWKPGDVIVAFLEEFPANYYCWKLLEERNACQVRWLSIYDPLEKIEAACRGARLLAISWVNYLSGHRVDLEALGEICRRHKVFFSSYTATVAPAEYILWLSVVDTAARLVPCGRHHAQTHVCL